MLLTLFHAEKLKSKNEHAKMQRNIADINPISVKTQY